MYLALESGEAVIKPPSRRSLALNGISTTPALTDSPLAAAFTQIPECEPEWVPNLTDTIKKMDDRIQSLEYTGTKATTLRKQTDRELKKTHDYTARLERRIERQAEEIDQLRDQLLSEQTRSMRSNLIFSGIPEGDQNENCESVVRDFLRNNMGVNDIDIVIERSHRLGGWQRGKNRPIVTKFLNFKDKETIRQAAPKTLRNTGYGVNEQFPKEITDKRKLLIPVLKAERRQQKRANLIVDKLYTDDATYIVRGDQVEKINNRHKNTSTHRNPPHYNQPNISQNKHQGQHNQPNTSLDKHHGQNNQPNNSQDQQHRQYVQPNTSQYKHQGQYNQPNTSQGQHHRQYVQPNTSHENQHGQYNPPNTSQDKHLGQYYYHRPPTYNTTHGATHYNERVQPTQDTHYYQNTTNFQNWPMRNGMPAVNNRPPR